MINPEIGGWGIVSDKEYVQLLRAGVPLPAGLGEEAHRCGLARKNGHSVFGKSGVKNEVLFFELHVSDECNLACQYCSSRTIPVGTISRTDPAVGFKWVDRVFEYCRNNNQRSTILELTGGEPLANVEFLDQIVGYALARARDEIRFKIVLVTNLTIVGPRQIEFLRKYPIQLNVSLDGDQVAHDGQRPFASGTGTFHVVMRNIRKLAAEGLAPSALQTTVTARTVECMRETVQFLMEMGYTHLNLQYMSEAGAPPGARGLKPDPELYVNKLFEVFETQFIPFWRSTGQMPYAKHLTVCYAYLLEPKRTYMCQSSPCGAGRNIFCTKSNGDVYGCATGPWDEEFRYGNVFRDSLEECQRSLAAQASSNRDVSALPKCSKCLYRGWCQGGCPKEAFSTTGTIFSPSASCRMFQALWQRALESLIDCEFPEDAVREQAKYYLR
jgi:uncharacterized protein